MENYKTILKEFISFKSISTDSEYKNECAACAKWLGDLFRSQGFTVKVIENSACNPVIFASYDNGSKETVCVYGHYDVQPSDGQPWTHDPFVVEEDEKYIYARGIVDNKGQVLIHIANVFDAIENKTLSKNVLFVIEGNEESGNPVLPEILKEHLPENITYTVISDGEIAGDNPAIEISLRGGANMKLILSTADTDVHSGIFGGAIPNAGEELVKLLSRIKDTDSQIVVPGFYDGIAAFPELYSPSDANLVPDELLTSLGIAGVKLEKGTDFYNQVGCCPTIQVTGMNTGYTGNGFANIVPSRAEARLNIRIVAGQDIEVILKNLEKYLTENTPNYCKITIEKTDGYPPILLNTESIFIKNVETMLETAFGKKVVYTFVGGGIPIVNDFIEITGKDVLLVPLGNDDCNMHGHDEKVNKNILEKSLQFSKMFWTS